MCYLNINLAACYHSNIVFNRRICMYTLHVSYATGEFGIVYRARLGPQGRAGREVAVKTLKGCWI